LIRPSPILYVLNDAFVFLLHFASRSLTHPPNHPPIKTLNRNLGRDDRIIASHGREARFPYLDEQVMSLLRSLPPSLKYALTLPMGVGDKQILRCVARERLGLEGAAALVKRAIQFGSRISREGSLCNFGSHRAGKQKNWRKKAASVGWVVPGGKGGVGGGGGREEEEEEEDESAM